MFELVSQDCQWLQLVERARDSNYRIIVQNHPSLAFPVNAVEYAYFTECDKTLRLVVNFWGLYGPDGLLPLNQQSNFFGNAEGSIRAFLDIFQRHLFQHYINLQMACNLPTDRKSPSENSRLLINQELRPHQPRIRYHIEHGLREIFEQLNVVLVDCIQAWIEVEQSNQALGQACCLGINALLGPRVVGQTSWVHIHIYDYEWLRFLYLLKVTQSSIHERISSLLGPMNNFVCWFHFDVRDVPTMSKLGSPHLGYNCQLGGAPAKNQKLTIRQAQHELPTHHRVKAWGHKSGTLRKFVWKRAF